MAKTLVLMRHAHAADHSVLDRERPLNTHGRMQAHTAGQLLVARGIQLMLASNATRCQQTLQFMDLRLPDGNPVPATIMPDLYLAGSDTIRSKIAEIPDDITGLLVLAHAPGIPGLASELAWAHAPGEPDRFGGAFPTARFAVFAVAGNWADLADPDYSGARPMVFS